MARRPVLRKEIQRKEIQQQKKRPAESGNVIKVTVTGISACAPI
jgi:hypothetical protein